MRRLVVGLILAGWASVVRAHIEPVYPIFIDVRADGHRMRVELDGTAGMWVEDILGANQFPAGNWGEEDNRRSESYINRHLVFSVNGTTVPGRVVGGRVLHQPWQSPAAARVRLRLVYDLPVPWGEMRGKAFFFQEEWDIHEGDGKPVLDLVRQFETRITVRGPRRLRLVVPIESPDFRLGASDLQRTPLQSRWESFSRGARWSGPLLLWGVVLGLALVGRGGALLLALAGYGLGLVIAPALGKPTFPVEWLAPVFGAGAALWRNPWARRVAAGAAATAAGAGMFLAGGAESVRLGFTQLSAALFAVASLASVLAAIPIGVLIPVVIRKSVAARGSDRSVEESDRWRRTILVAIAVFSLVWMARYLRP